MTDSDEFLAPIIERLKEPVDVAPDLASRVMAELAATEPPATRAPVRWWRRRWTIQVSPIGALAVAAGLAAVAVGANRLGRAAGAAPAPAASAIASQARLTQFVLVAPEAGSVAVVGDFNDWNLAATPLSRAEGDGVWSVTVPLEPGRYRYAFVVDGTVWRGDPEAPALENEFGQPNSVVTIGGA